jgi:small subunit ribosomal protein S6
MARCYTHRRFLPREPSRSRAAAASEAELDRRKEIREPVTDYEVLIMFDPELAEDRQQEVVDRIRTQVVEGGGVWETHTPWGRRRLAYEILHKSEGIYHLLIFSASPEVLSEVSRLLKIDDAVLRHMAVRRVKGSSTSAPTATVAASASTVEPDLVQEDE